MTKNFQQQTAEVFSAMHPENSLKSVVISASVRIHNAQTKGAHCKSVMTPAYKDRWQHPLSTS